MFVFTRAHYTPSLALTISFLESEEAPTLHSNSISASMHAHMSDQPAVKNWQEFKLGSATKSQNHKIACMDSSVVACRDRILV